MKSIQEKQFELIEAYNGLNDQLMQYEFLLQLAGETPLPEEKWKNESTRIRNCQTDSWIIMRVEQNRFFMSVDSDSLLIRGILSIYVYLLDGRLLSEVMDTPLSFMENTDIKKQLSLARLSVLSKIPDMIIDFCQLKTVVNG